MEPRTGSIDLREAKASIGRLLPFGNPLREAFLREADFLSIEEARSKLPIYLRMALAQRPN